MKETGMLFNADMVRAILEGRKTQTRRAIKPQPANDPAKHHPIKPYLTATGNWNWVLATTGHGTGDPSLCPYGVPGDRLWVRETFSYDRLDVDRSGVLPPWYWADGSPASGDWSMPKPSIHMPRWASRITLEITNVRVERLSEINEADAEQEGCALSFEDEFGIVHGQPQYKFGFRKLWESINGAGSWDLNPFCWVIEFKRAEKTN